MSDPATIFGQWEKFVGWLLDLTAKFPRPMRHTLTNRIESLALEVYEGLVDARYTRDRLPILKRMNLNLEKLRLLLRLAHERKMLSDRAFSFGCQEIDQTGRMLGGWVRSLGRTPDGTSRGSDHV